MKPKWEARKNQGGSRRVDALCIWIDDGGFKTLWIDLEQRGTVKSKGFEGISCLRAVKGSDDSRGR